MKIGNEFCLVLMMGGQCLHILYWHLSVRHWGVSSVQWFFPLWIVFLHFQISKLWAGWRWKVGGREEKDKINDSPSGNINFPFAPMLTCGWNQNGSNKTKRLHRNENKTKKRKIWQLMVPVAFDYESWMVYDYESLIVFILPSLHISYQLCGSMDLFAKLYSALF